MFKRKRTIFAFVAIAIVAAALVIARSYFLKKFQSSVLDEIQLLNESPINIHYDTIYLDWKRNILTVENLVIERDAYDTTCIYPEFISCHKVQVKGIGLLSLIFQSELDIDELLLIKPRWVIHKNSNLFSDSSTVKKQNNFAAYIDMIRLDSMRMELTDSSTCKLVTRMQTSARVKNLSYQSESNGGKPKITFSEIQTTSTRLDLPGAFYTFLIRSSTLNLSERTFTLDTMRIVPSFGKLQFGREAGTDLDRIEGVFPFIKATQFNFQFADTIIADAGKVDLQFYLKIFHDKRLPHKKRVVPLPLEQLKKLPFGLMIDELAIRKSFVQYEEVPANADVAGHVYFDNIHGKLSSVSNDQLDLERETVLVAKADFMGQGDLSIKALFPWNPKRRGSVKGSLTGFSFEKLNGMVEPAANVQFESGRLNELNFAFNFNDRVSEGSLSINYRDLKLVALRTDEQIEKVVRKKRNRKKSEEDLRKDDLKTFIVNAFVLRKNLDENVPEEKRLGTISFERDRSRSIFNFWWKSMFTGIKSAFNLDKAEATAKKIKGRKRK
jgi:hypothetical protein